MKRRVVEDEYFNKIMKHFGKQLQEVRKENFLTQKKLAEELEISIHSIAQMEQGVKAPSLFMFYKIANHFDISLDYFRC